MSDTHTPPDWLTEGAPVVLWNSRRTGYLGDHDPEAFVTTVKKISKTSFSVEGEDTRIYFKGMRSTEKGSSWSHYYRLADTPDSDKAQQALTKTARVQLKTSVTRAVDAWQKSDNPDTLTAALVALVALAKADGIRPGGTESEEA